MHGQCSRAGVPATWREEATLIHILQTPTTLPIGLKYSIVIPLALYALPAARVTSFHRKQIHAQMIQP